jgi:hypothetical protein
LVLYAIWGKKLFMTVMIRIEDVFSIASFNTSVLIIPGACCTYLFSQSGIAWRYMWK